MEWNGMGWDGSGWDGMGMEWDGSKVLQFGISKIG